MPVREIVGAQWYASSMVSGTLRELQAGVTAALPRENMASMPSSAT